MHMNVITQPPGRPEGILPKKSAGDWVTTDSPVPVRDPWTPSEIYQASVLVDLWRDEFQDLGFGSRLTFDWIESAA